MTAKAKTVATKAKSRGTAKKRATKKATAKKVAVKKFARKRPHRSFLADAKKTGFVLKADGPKVYVVANNEVRAYRTHPAYAASARSLLAKLGIRGAEYELVRKKVRAGLATTLWKGGKT